MEKVYIVRYSGGSYEDYYANDIFVTVKKSTATKYVTRFNKTLKKWKAYYKQFEEENYGMPWIKEEHVEKHFHRWNRIRNISNCYWEEIKVR